MTIFGLDIEGEHARIILTALGTALATVGYFAGRWTDHLGRVRFKREDLVTSSVIIELYAVTPEDGRDVLHIVSQGSSSTIDSFFRSPVLVHHIQKAAKSHPGLLKLPNHIAHRMMMDEGKDTLTGLDAKANMDFVHGRPTRKDETLFAFAAYPEVDHDGDGLRDQVARLVLMVVSPAVAAKLADPKAIEALAVAHAGYLPRAKRLHDFAREWQRLQRLPHAERRSSIDKIWQIRVRTSLT